MRTQLNFFKTASHLFVCLNLFLATTPGAFSQSIEPASCIRPTVTPPAAFVQTPVNMTLPSATTINVRLSGAAGNGTTIDSDVIQSIINSNPNGTIYFPLGLYRLHNSSFDQPGLLFQNFHGTAIMQSGARFLCDTITVGVAGQCIYILNSSNATFANFDIGYIGDAALPYPRSEAGNNALLVEDSQNITISNTLVEHSPGPGIWVTGSTGINFLNGTSVNNTTADGLHFENDGSSSVVGYFSQNTGDDALSATNQSTGVINCGLSATNIQIYRSLSSGIADRGACDASFSNFYIDTTANSGLMIGADANFNMLAPTSATFTNGTVLSAGRYSSPVVAGKDCIDISASQGTSITNVACVYPLISGIRTDGGANAVTLNGVTVDAAPNLGFQIDDATNVWLTNTISRNSAGGGYVFNTGYSWGSVVGAYACNSGLYGFYHAGVSNVAESNLVSYDSSEGNSSNRAWWAENGSSNISLNGIKLFDDQTTQPIVVGSVGGNGTININGVSLDSTLGATFSILTQ
ncbi:MAG: right-handed parallel beta-helix repeat-containing protein [Terracidiphilus sp.]